MKKEFFKKFPEISELITLLATVKSANAPHAVPDKDSVGPSAIGIELAEILEGRMASAEGGVWGCPPADCGVWGAS